ncbi:MAG: c-type cytochrome [Rubrimonas sp.]|uniref:c-type cytochrome n=1 Tax=Rubrimonas sp. TaxID=2036015 RepID=UPI002FDD5AC8
MRLPALAAALTAAALVAATAFAEPQGFARLEGHGGPVQSVARSPDGAVALTTSFDYAAGLWNIDEARLIRWLDGHEAAVTTGAFAPDGSRALTGSDDFTLILWDVATGEALARFEGHTAKVQHVAVAADGRMAASASWDGRIGLWDLDAGASLGFLTGHRGGVNAVAFSGDGATLWSAGHDGTVRRWDVATRAFEAVEAEHGFGVNLLTLNEDAGWLAYGALDGGVRVLDLATGAQIADITAGRRPALGLALSPDRTLIAVGDGEGYINVASTEDWQSVRDFRAVPRGPIWALDFDGTGRRLLAGGLDSHVDIWPIDDARSAQEADLLRPFQLSEGMSNGERQFVRKCSICHSLTPDGGRRAGPSLHGLFGRPAGTLASYDYSEALERATIVWTEETVDKLFEIGPDYYTPGSKMPMQRIAKPQDRADLVAWLRAATATQESTP